MVLGLGVPAFLLLVITPRLTGESLADSEFAEAAAAAATMLPGLDALDPAGQAQAFVLQHFLMFSLIVPVLGSLSLAAQAHHRREAGAGAGAAAGDAAHRPPSC